MLVALSKERSKNVIYLSYKAFFLYEPLGKRSDEPSAPAVWHLCIQSLWRVCSKYQVSIMNNKVAQHVASLH